MSEARSSTTAGPRITVITVCFNSSGTLADALDSVASQNWPHVEHIIVDGGSSDGTLDVIASHGRHAAKVVSEPDRGIYDAMNKGLALATGDYVGYLNADDMLADPDVLRRVASAAAATEPWAPAVYGDLVYVSHKDASRVVRHWRSGAYRPSRLTFGWMPPHPTFYASRQLLQQHGGFDTSLRIAADYDLMLRVLVGVNTPPAYLPDVMVRMRTGGASNRSLRAMWRKSREDLGVLRAHRIGGLFSLACKNLRKLPQFLSGRRLS